MDTIYKKHSSVKLWIATAMLIFSCLTTSVFAQKLLSPILLRRLQRPSLKLRQTLLK